MPLTLGTLYSFKIYTLSEPQTLLAPVLVRYGARRAVLFGSYAKGQTTEHSDADFWVDSGPRDLAFYGLLENIAYALRIIATLTDVQQVEPGSFVACEIQRSGVVIFKQ